MIEYSTDFWEMAELADGIVIPTNGIVNKDGYAVMGKGLALEAKKRWPNLPRGLGQRLLETGNHVYFFESHYGLDPENIITFPTKNDWRDPADIELIEQSAKDLVVVATALGLNQVVLPMVGCGAGGLNYSEVQSVLWRHLDDRFRVALGLEKP